MKNSSPNTGRDRLHFTWADYGWGMAGVHVDKQNLNLAIPDIGAYNPGDLEAKTDSQALTWTFDVLWKRRTFKSEKDKNKWKVVTSDGYTNDEGWSEGYEKCGYDAEDTSDGDESPNSNGDPTTPENED